jgi:transcriptional regulator with XRE-family HTH domain
MLKAVLKHRKLDRWLMKNNLTMRSFGKSIGVSSGFISQIATGERNPGPQIRQKIMDATGLTFDDLFTIRKG